MVEMHVISTGQQTSGTVASIAEKIHTYVDAFHLREQSWSDREMVEAIKLLISQGIPREKIVVNSRIDVAQIMETRGVQLTHNSVDVSRVRSVYDHLCIGCSVHSTEDAIYATRHGADYLLYGHVFESKSKLGLKPKGLENLERVAQSVSIPVIAIGGITPENTVATIKSGATGIAVLSGVMLSDNPLKAVKEYRRALRKAGEENEATV
ncbi:thiamine phosphate synthase [Virgibacillus sp. FSP13]